MLHEHIVQWVQPHIRTSEAKSLIHTPGSFLGALIYETHTRAHTSRMEFLCCNFNIHMLSYAPMAIVSRTICAVICICRTYLRHLVRFTCWHIHLPQLSLLLVSLRSCNIQSPRNHHSCSCLAIHILSPPCPVQISLASSDDDVREGVTRLCAHVLEHLP